VLAIFIMMLTILSIPQLKNDEGKNALFHSFVGIQAIYIQDHKPMLHQFSRAGSFVSNHCMYKKGVVIVVELTLE
jgi:hypothetical protein